MTVAQRVLVSCGCTAPRLWVFFCEAVFLHARKGPFKSRGENPSLCLAFSPFLFLLFINSLYCTSLYTVKQNWLFLLFLAGLSLCFSWISTILQYLYYQFCSAFKKKKSSNRLKKKNYRKLSERAHFYRSALHHRYRLSGKQRWKSVLSISQIKNLVSLFLIGTSAKLCQQP